MPPLADDRTACFAFDMRDWRFDHDAADQLPEDQNAPWRVSIVRKGDGVVLTFQRPNDEGEPEQREVLVEISRGRPKLNVYTEAGEDAAAIILVDRDHVLATTGGVAPGLSSVCITEDSITPCPDPDEL